MTTFFNVFGEWSAVVYLVGMVLLLLLWYLNRPNFPK
jgi:hypothetical protein